MEIITKSSNTTNLGTGVPHGKMAQQLLWFCVLMRFSTSPTWEIARCLLLLLILLFLLFLLLLFLIIIIIAVYYFFILHSKLLIYTHTFKHKITHTHINSLTKTRNVTQKIHAHTHDHRRCYVERKRMANWWQSP